MSVRFLPNRHGRHKCPYFQNKRTPSLPHLTEGHSVLRGRWRRQATDEVRPRSGRAVIASFGEVKFVRRDESAFGVMLSKMSAFADISPIGDKKSSRTFQRNFSEEKFLSEGPQSDCNRHEGPSLFMPLCGMKIHSSCALRMQRKFRALRSATKGSAFGIREPLKRLDPNFVPRCASKSYVNITWVSQIFTDITRVV